MVHFTKSMYIFYYSCLIWHFLRVVKKEKVEEKKTYDWKKGVKKAEKKEPEEPKAPEKVALKKPKIIEKPKEAEKEGIKLKAVPPKEKQEPEKKEDVKLKPIPQKEKEVCRTRSDIFMCSIEGLIGNLGADAMLNIVKSFTRLAIDRDKLRNFECGLWYMDF